MDLFINNALSFFYVDLKPKVNNIAIYQVAIQSHGVKFLSST